MRLSAARILITGGAGGIGRAIAAELLARGAATLLVDRDAAALETASRALQAHGERVGTHVADLTVPGDRAQLCAAAQRWRGGIDVLVNNAGLSHFALYAEQPPAQIDAALAVNVQAPMHLCQALLPHLLRQPEARILNVGSVFGAIGYPGYVAYSASKFAIRGFSEALSRELAGSSVSVHYLAPRATRTPINSSAVERMNAELGVAMDPPQKVAAAVARMLERGEPRAVLGWPESLFVRLNALLPRLVDGALRRQLPTIRRYAAPPPPTPAAADPASPDLTRSIS